MDKDEQLYNLLSEKLATEYVGPEMVRIREFIEIHIGVRPLPESHPMQEATKFFFPHLRQLPWYDTKEFSWCKIVEDAAPLIKSELIGLEGGSVNFQLYKDSTDQNYVGWPGWEVLPIYVWNQYTEAGTHCPQTIAALEKVPHGPRQGMFSRMKPGARIYPHTGGTNIFLTCHLALEVPPNCRMRVGDDTREWKEGRVCVFDDSFEHECWNESKSPRKVLIWDIWHPDLTPMEIQVLTELIKIIEAPLAH